MNDLPSFIDYPFEQAQDFARRAFNHGDKPEDSHLISLLPQADHHFRAIFSLNYFTLAAEQPSKSQWSTLKKRLKRMNPRVFIFKEHGLLPGENAGYLDFGFLPK